MCRLNHKNLGQPTFLQFSAVPHPPIRPSASRGPAADFCARLAVELTRFFPPVSSPLAVAYSSGFASMFGM